MHPPSFDRIALGAALGLLTCLLTPDASAQAPSGGFGRPVLDPEKKAEAKGHFDRGADLYAQGAYDQALVEWSKAYEISQHPLIFESMANAYERLGRPREAKEALAKWRAEAPPEEHENLDRRLANLDARVKKLEEEAAAKAEAEKKGAAGGGADSSEEEGVLGPLGVAGVVVGAVGVGLVGGGVVVGIVASGQRPEEAEVCRAGGGGSLCLESAKEDIDSSGTLALVSDIMWITGAVAAAAGGTMLVLDLTGAIEDDAEADAAPESDARARRDTRRRGGATGSIAPRAQLVPIASPAGAGLSFRGTW